MSTNASRTIHNGWLWSQQAVKYECMFKDFMAEKLVHEEQFRRDGVKSILFVRTDAIGDAILASMLPAALRAKHPEAKITVVCQDITAKLYDHNPDVDAVMPFHAATLENDGSALARFIEKIKGERFDLAVNSIWSRTVLSDVLTLNSRARMTVAHEGDDCNIGKQERKQLSQLYTTIVPRSRPHCPELQRHFDFARALKLDTYKPRMRVFFGEREKAFAEAFFDRTGFDPAKTVALFCGVQTSVRQYGFYGQALERLCRQRGLSVVALGSAGDRAVNAANLAQLTTPHHNLSGQATLLETAAVLKRCAAAVGAETGLGHMATALGRPTAVLLGGGHFGRFMPFSPLQSVACLPLECYGCNWSCRHDHPWCVADVHPRTLEAALAAALDKKGLKPKVVMQPRECWPSEPGRPQWALPKAWLPAGTVEFVTVPVAAYDDTQQRDPRDVAKAETA